MKLTNCLIVCPPDGNMESDQFDDISKFIFNNTVLTVSAALYNSIVDLIEDYNKRQDESK